MNITPTQRRAIRKAEADRWKKEGERQRAWEEFLTDAAAGRGYDPALIIDVIDSAGSVEGGFCYWEVMDPWTKHFGYTAHWDNP